jgi:hypothetical protein
MKQRQVFNLKTATLAFLSTEDDHRIPVTIPSGATVTVLDADVNGKRFVDVEWERKTLTMFAVDLRNRGKLVRAIGA